nr:MAG TPA: hypothetical protein [Caudoviricetes sp.]
MFPHALKLSYQIEHIFVSVLYNKIIIYYTKNKEQKKFCSF